MNIGEWWELQEPGRKRTIAIVGGLIVLFAVLWMIPGKEAKEVAKPVSDVEVDILGDDQGAGDIQQLAAELKVIKGEREQMQRSIQQQGRRIQQLQNSLAAATNIAENPEQLGALVDELNRMKEDLDELRENGVSGGGGGEAPPVQLVLGGEQNDAQNGLETNNNQPSVTSPFSDVNDEDAGPIAKYDPLARIKGAIEDGAAKETQKDGSRFGFMKDSSFERPPPKIVIEEAETSDTRPARSAGSRPGQTARDRRGEAIEVREQPEVYIPSGSLFEGILLNGMDAPTAGNAARDPYPATIRLTSLAFLPNRYTTNIRECFVGAAGFGRLDSERVHLRTETLSCVLNDGKIIDVPLEGYISGEDGKVGLRGVVVERTGQLLMRAALSGLGAGFAQALEPRQVASVRTGSQAGGIEFDAPDPKEVLEIGAYKGASTAMEKIADYYLERAEQIFPIIEIDAMRKVTVHLTTGVRLKPLEDSEFGALAKNDRVR